jgi:hypothetical protein
MGDVLKILIECSFDNLFVLTGLGFMGIGIVGNIWKIQPGKWGRLGSATLSPILVCAGLWMHTHEHITQFKVVRLDFQAASSAYNGGCPVEIKFPGQIESSGAGIVRYEVEYSDGIKTAPLQLEFDHPEVKHIKVSRQFEQSRPDGWARINILSPDTSESEKVSFVVMCHSAVATHGRTSKGNAAAAAGIRGPRTEIASGWTR